MRVLILVFFLFLFSCHKKKSLYDKDSVQLEQNRIDSLKSESLKVYKSHLLTTDSKNVKDQLWAFENLLNFDQIFLEKSFRLWIKDDLIQVYELDKNKLITIKYHPFWSNESKIECHIITDSKSVVKLEIDGDRNSAGNVHLEESEGGLVLKHILYHPVATTDIIDTIRSDFMLDQKKLKFIKLNSL